MNHPNSPAFDLLDLDGGWLTAEGISVASDHQLSTRSITRSMMRWAGKGFIETRSVGLTGVETRREFRVTSVRSPA